jgi:hypothetical protein
MKALLLIALLFGQFPFAQGQGTKVAVHFRITGTALNDRNGEPIPFCHMSASLIVAARPGQGFGQRPGEEGGGRFGRGQDAVEADADARGRFALEVPSEGKYRLSGSAKGFRVQFYEAHGAFSTAVVLTKAAPVHTVVFRASSDATISGEVTDEAGEAVRNAQVRLYLAADPTRTAEEARLQMRNVTQTDDRGHYELTGLQAGSYEVSVTGRPWYTTQSPPAQVVNGVVVPPLDPSLDVVYPVMWFPGTDDERSAEKIALKYGERRQVDFRLTAIPAAHVLLSVPVQTPAPGGDARVQGSYQVRPVIQRIGADGMVEGISMSMRGMGAGQTPQLDIGGLAPGTYRISEPAASINSPATFSVLHIGLAGSVSDTSMSVPEVPVVIRVDGDPTVTAGQVSLTDTTTGWTATRGRMMGVADSGVDPGGRGRRDGGGASDEVTIYAPAGSYEVTVAGRNSFLTGVTATGAQVTGRVVKIAEGSPHLTVHMAAGLASIDGTAMRQGKPSSGAMVLLVPATMGDPANLLFERRAQTATDGSFQMTNVMPGQYILLVIDHGWEVNWRDVGTLRPYLLQGEPLDLTASATVHPAVQAIAP